MADRDSLITADTALVSPSLLARTLGVSPEKVQEAAKSLGIEFSTTLTRRALTSFRDCQRLARHIAR